MRAISEPSISTIHEYPASAGRSMGPSPIANGTISGVPSTIPRRASDLELALEAQLLGRVAQRDRCTVLVHEACGERMLAIGLVPRHVDLDRQGMHERARPAQRPSATEDVELAVRDLSRVADQHGRVPATHRERRGVVGCVGTGRLIHGQEASRTAAGIATHVTVDAVAPLAVPAPVVHLLWPSGR